MFLPSPAGPLASTPEPLWPADPGSADPLSAPLPVPALALPPAPSEPLPAPLAPPHTETGPKQQYYIQHDYITIYTYITRQVESRVHYDFQHISTRFP